MAGAATLRVMTYNVHRCVGRGGAASLDDVAALCVEAAPDVVALQELDAPETDDGAGVHHARDLADRLGMAYLFLRTYRRHAGCDYGHALLSRHPLALRRAALFAAPPGARWEPRGAIWARITVGEVALDVVATHLGVNARERGPQAAELVGPAWLGGADVGARRILLGDMNALPWTAAYRRLAGHLRDAQRQLATRPRPTFPARLPVARIDHVFVSPDLDVRAAEVPASRAARRASDHRPLIVDLEVGLR